MKTDAELEAVFPVRKRESNHPERRCAVFLTGYAHEELMLCDWTTGGQAEHIQTICMTAYRVGWNARMEADAIADANLAGQTRLLRDALPPSALAADKLFGAINAAMARPNPS